jgi:hypothetical protein
MFNNKKIFPISKIVTECFSRYSFLLKFRVPDTDVQIDEAGIGINQD